jgi:nicotinate-nucleotide adenylyltransferase
MGPRIGIYGGAFDPPHRAHVAMAHAFVAQARLDVLYVVPTGNAYHRSRPLTDAAHRLAMARLAFAPPAVVDAIEVNRSGPSYTIDTVEAIRLRHATDSPVHVLVGEDQWERIGTWHRVEALVQIATFIVAKRPSGTPAIPQKDSKYGLEGRFEALAWQEQPLSATQIRAAREQGQSIDGWVTPAVARYIDEHRLYRSN